MSTYKKIEKEIQKDLDKRHLIKSDSRKIDQRSRIENPRIDPRKYSQLIFDQGKQMVVKQLDMHMQKETDPTNPDIELVSFTKFNSRSQS